MKKIKVSAIVPVYNSEKYLEECLDSLINQTLTEIEIICVDDGSTDNSPKILNDYSNKDNRIKIITQENKDVGAARETGLKIAKGEYIAFVDNDDWLVLDAFEKLYKNAKSNDSDMVMFKVAFYYSENHVKYLSAFDLKKYFDENVDFNNFTFNARNIKEQVMNTYFAPWYKFYKSEFLKGHNFYFKSNITYPDVPLHVQAMLKAKKISFCPQTLYFYRQGHQEAMISVSKNTSRIFDIFEVIDEVESFLIENHLMEDYQFEFSLFKLQRINFWFRTCGEGYKDEYFDKSKKEILDMNLSEISLENLPNTLKNFYLNILSSNSYYEADKKIKIDRSKIEMKYQENEFKRGKNRSLIQRFSSKFPYFYILFKFNNGVKNTIITIRGVNSIKKNNLFDIGYYLYNNKKVKKDGMDPLLHYIYHGYKKNLKPNPNFDGKKYLNKYKDVKKSKLNPLVHYSLFGKREGRKSNFNRRFDN